MLSGPDFVEKNFAAKSVDVIVEVLPVYGVDHFA
jgi:hypothetical protein